jgi:hypothetical protein
VFPSDLPGVNLATLNGMLIYYRLMTKWSGLGDSTELSRVGLSQLQFSLSISALQNPNFAWRSCSNRREKHRTTLTNVIEGYLIYNFRIYHFCRTVQIFGKTRSQSRSTADALGRRRRVGRPAGAERATPSQTRY